MRAAGNRSTPPEVLTELASDEHEYVRMQAAGNSSTPPETLTELADDEHEDVRMALAFNRATPLEQLVYLLDDDFGEVRRYITYALGERLEAEAGYRPLKFPRPVDAQPELKTKRLECALVQHVLACARLGDLTPTRVLYLDGDTYTRLVNPPRAVAKTVADLLEFLARLDVYAPVSECVDAGELLATLPKYRQDVAWTVLGEHPSQPLRAVRSVVRAAGNGQTLA